MSSVYLTKEKFLADNIALKQPLPYAKGLSALSAPLIVGGKVVPNRLACQAMEGCDGLPDGRPGELTHRRYERLAKGGAGIIWFEATAVLPEGKANPRQLYITEANVDAFARQVEEIKETAQRENGCMPLLFLQATHSGRYSKPNGSQQPLVAYSNPILENSEPLYEDAIVSDEYLDTVRDALVHGAELAKKAGFDGVDIKCSHGYLNSELLSAYMREGRYGGSFENRTRLLLESVRGAKEMCGGDFLVSSRLNIYDGLPYPYGFGVPTDGSLDFDPEEPIRLVRELSASRVEFLNITMGNPYFNPHINRPYAAGEYEPPEHPLCGVSRMLNGTLQVKRAVPEMLILCSGLTYLGIAAPHVAAALVELGDIDIAGFGRTVLSYPDFANDILHAGGMQKEKCCLCCSKCTQIMRQPGGTPGCVLRDAEVYLPIYQSYFGGTIE